MMRSSGWVRRRKLSVIIDPPTLHDARIPGLCGEMQNPVRQHAAAVREAAARPSGVGQEGLCSDTPRSCTSRPTLLEHQAQLALPRYRCESHLQPAPIQAWRAQSANCRSRSHAPPSMLLQRGQKEQRAVCSSSSYTPLSLDRHAETQPCAYRCNSERVSLQASSKQTPSCGSLLLGGVVRRPFTRKLLPPSVAAVPGAPTRSQRFVRAVRQVAQRAPATRHQRHANPSPIRPPSHSCRKHPVVAAPRPVCRPSPDAVRPTALGPQHEGCAHVPLRPCGVPVMSSGAAMPSRVCAVKYSRQHLPQPVVC